MRLIIFLVANRPRINTEHEYLLLRYKSPKLLVYIHSCRENMAPTIVN